MQEGGAHENSPAAAAAATTTTTTTTTTKATARSSQEEPQPQPASAKPPEQAAKMVKCVGSLEEFQTELASAGGKLIVIDFSATWCGPCKMIKPFFHELADRYPNIIFIEIDVDEAQDVASHCDVKCMPTFQFYKNNVKVHEFSGANKEKLEETIKNLK